MVRAFCSILLLGCLLVCGSPATPVRAQAPESDLFPPADTGPEPERDATGAPVAPRESASPAPLPARETTDRSSGDPASGGGAPAADRPPLEQLPHRPRAPMARVSSGSGSLPNDAGQIYREYDIVDYTKRVTNTNSPEQALIDWILRETGYEAWHTGPVVAVLHADREKLRVYHTPEMQALVGEIVDRFVNTEAETHTFGVRVVTVDNPNWRSRAMSVLRPVAVQSQGIQAWLLAKEDAALLMADLRRRSDFKEHSAPHLMVANGQSTVVAATRPRKYMRGIVTRPEIWPGFDTDWSQIDEGYTFELNPLLSLDGRLIDAVVKCNIDQVERLLPVTLDVPTTVASRQQTKIEVPQVSQCRLHERFRWPTDQVLLVGLGMVAPPTAAEPAAFRLPLLSSAPERSDLLLFIESRGRTGQPISVTRAEPAPVTVPAQALRGRR